MNPCRPSCCVSWWLVTAAESKGWQSQTLRAPWKTVCSTCRPLRGSPASGVPRGMPACSPGSLRRASRVHGRSEEHTSELQSQSNLVCRLLLEKKKNKIYEYPRYQKHGTSCRSSGESSG